MCMQVHLAHVAFEISDHSPKLLDTPRIYSYVDSWCVTQNALESIHETHLVSRLRTLPTQLVSAQSEMN
jgi:hypothetical protein